MSAEQKKYFVYIALCADGTLYTGYTNNIAERERIHNEGIGAKYTRSRLPVMVIYQEPWDTKSDAMRREREIKGMTKANKQMLLRTYFKTLDSVMVAKIVAFKEAHDV